MAVEVRSLTLCVCPVLGVRGLLDWILRLIQWLRGHLLRIVQLRSILAIGVVVVHVGLRVRWRDSWVEGVCETRLFEWLRSVRLLQRLLLRDVLLRDMLLRVGSGVGRGDAAVRRPVGRHGEDRALRRGLERV